MRPFARYLPILFVVLVGCGGGDDDGTGDDDGDAPAIDADTSSVVNVDCAGATIAQTFTTSGNAYVPASATISVGEVVEFMPAASHNIASNDGLFRVGFGGHECFQFNEAGSYTFHCEAHPFSGTLTVQ